MASLHKLASGRWQASVLLGNGLRTTETFDSSLDAQEWATGAEAKRDGSQMRVTRQSADDHIALMLAALEEHAQQGGLREQHCAHLARILQASAASWTKGSLPLAQAN